MLSISSIRGETGPAACGRKAILPEVRLMTVGWCKRGMDRERFSDCAGLEASIAGKASGGVGSRACIRERGRERLSSVASVESIDVAPSGGDADEVVDRESVLSLQLLLRASH
jgi:hypothetical protein